MAGEIYELFRPSFTRYAKVKDYPDRRRQYQLALARALITRPRLLILDEPSRGGGPRFAQARGFTGTVEPRYWPDGADRRTTPAVYPSGGGSFLSLHCGRSVAQGDVMQLDAPLLAKWMTPDQRAEIGRDTGRDPRAAHSPATEFSPSSGAGSTRSSVARYSE